MRNTCLIGRRWKPCEGWSRPVLTGERGTLFQPFPLWWVGSRPVVVSRWMARNAVSCGRETKDRSVLFASVVRFPDRHDRNRGWFRCRPPVLPVGRCIGFAVVMAQVRRPVPFRTRKLRPGRGDGTALERVWESSTPPHSTYGPSGRAPSGFPGGLFLFPRTGVFLRSVEVFGRRKARGREDRSTHWEFCSAGRPVGGRIVPVSGGIGTLRDPRNFKGASCSYPMVG